MLETRDVPGATELEAPSRRPPIRRVNETPHSTSPLARAEARGNSHVRFLGGPGAAMRPAYPADGRVKEMPTAVR
jgi:hypothetical protein